LFEKGVQTKEKTGYLGDEKMKKINAMVFGMLVILLLISATTVTVGAKIGPPYRPRDPIEILSKWGYSYAYGTTLLDEGEDEGEDFAQVYLKDSSGEVYSCSGQLYTTQVVRPGLYVAYGSQDVVEQYMVDELKSCGALEYTYQKIKFKVKNFDAPWIGLAIDCSLYLASSSSENSKFHARSTLEVTLSIETDPHMWHELWRFEWSTDADPGDKDSYSDRIREVVMYLNDPATFRLTIYSESSTSKIIPGPSSPGESGAFAGVGINIFTFP
jgi:hypothetical protein